MVSIRVIRNIEGGLQRVDPPKATRVPGPELVAHFAPNLFVDHCLQLTLTAIRADPHPRKPPTKSRGPPNFRDRVIVGIGRRRRALSPGCSTG